MTQQFDEDVIVSGTYKVGIGTTTPSAKLHVVGPGTPSIPTALIENAGSAKIQFSDTTQNRKWQVGTGAEGYYVSELSSMALPGGSPVPMTLNRLVVQKGSGNVGIGTDKPEFKMDVGGTIRAISKAQNTAVLGVADTGIGLHATSEQSIAVRAEAKKTTAVFGTSIEGCGVHGWSEQNIAVRAEALKTTAVYATSNEGCGVHGWSGQNIAVRAEAPKATAVYATSDEGYGVHGASEQNIAVRAEAKKTTAVFGTSIEGCGVHGWSEQNIAVRAEAPKATAVYATSDEGYGVHGASEQNIAVRAEAKKTTAVYGTSIEGCGVHGWSEQNIAVRAEAPKATAVYATSNEGYGVHGVSEKNIGVLGTGATGVTGKGKSNGVWGSTASANDSGVFGQNSGGGSGVCGQSASGIGVYGSGGKYAGYFAGKVKVTGDIDHDGKLTCKQNIECWADIFLTNADCAEDFDIPTTEEIEPGSVMVIGAEGGLCQSTEAYDKKVAGVISGAGDYKPGMVLDRQASQTNRMPVSLMGKVYCKVDAQYAPIDVGDLLTTSPTSGHAMKATDPLKAFGAVIGKALRPLKEGTGLIPILIALQ